MGRGVPKITDYPASMLEIVHFTLNTTDFRPNMDNDIVV